MMRLRDASSLARRSAAWRSRRWASCAISASRSATSASLASRSASSLAALANSSDQPSSAFCPASYTSSMFSRCSTESASGSQVKSWPSGCQPGHGTSSTSSSTGPESVCQPELGCGSWRLSPVPTADSASAAGERRIKTASSGVTAVLSSRTVSGSRELQRRKPSGEALPVGSCLQSSSLTQRMVAPPSGACTVMDISGSSGSSCTMISAGPSTRP
mmetsp:Transcript_67373/g.196974  ORF Transcript_67373/g.196974 Transcript_67373/m.196974 type:complete len:217 (+) Transcript_67373:937-1587(+)